MKWLAEVRRRREEAKADEADAAKASALFFRALGDGMQRAGESMSGAPSPSGCSSDFSCGIGQTCVKRNFSSTGVCMKKVNEYGGVETHSEWLARVEVERELSKRPRSSVASWRGSKPRRLRPIVNGKPDSTRGSRSAGLSFSVACLPRRSKSSNSRRWRRWPWFESQPRAELVIVAHFASSGGTQSAGNLQALSTRIR